MMRKLELKAKDIAEIMGVSTATVSLAINNKPGVSEKKRQEILNKIKELHCEYMLKTNPDQRGSVGFIVFKRYEKIVNESPFFNYFIEGINYKLSRYGYTMSLGIINSTMSKEEQEAYIRAMNCEGFIIFGVEMIHEDLRVFKETDLPFVVMDNAFKESDIDSVAINNMQGVGIAVRYLAEMGHKRIGYIRCKQRINSFEERFAAFQYHLKQMGLRFDGKDIIDVNYSEVGAKEDTLGYLKKNSDLPTAYFVENDFLACSAMQAMMEFGYRIPGDISLVGFDNRPITQLVHPNLTTVNVPKDIFGPVTVELLIERMEQGRRHSLKLEVGTDLVEGGSVKNCQINKGC